MLNDQVLFLFLEPDLYCLSLFDILLLCQAKCFSDYKRTRSNISKRKFIRVPMYQNQEKRKHRCMEKDAAYR